MSAIANSNQPEDKPKTSRVSSYWRNIPWKKLSSLLMAIALCFYLTACGGDNKPVSKAPTATVAPNINITEVSPPNEIQRLGRLLERYTPQVSIVSPKPDEVLNDTQVSVKFDVKNLPIFKNADFGLGPHIHVTLDNQEYKAVYDLTQTATFDHLSAGTHTIRAFASRPWHESFKNQGAYAQTTFHVLTKTGENTPEPKTPLLTYSRPVGTYGAEPIMLDFYLQNAPLHLLGKEEEAIDDWQVRATIDGKSFTFDRWEPIYLKGFKTGQNWVKLELLEPDGDAIANVFNSTAHLINYQPNGSDTLARLVSGEKIANIEAIVNPDYVPPAPVVTPAPVESASPEPAAITPTEKPAETPKAVVPSPAPAIKEETKPSVVPVIPAPVPVVPVPVAPIKTTPDAIAPIAPKSAPITELIKSKSTPVLEPVKVAPVTAPVITKVVPVKVAPVAEPAKVTPLKVKAAPVPVVVEPAKPVTPPVKVKTAPVVVPTKAISPKVVAPPVNSKESAKNVTQAAPKSETVKDVLPEKEPKTFKPTAAPKDVFKNFSNFDPRNFFPAKTEETKPESSSPDTKETSEVKPEAKSTDKPPALTDLSTTTSTPVKVLTKK